MNQDEAKARAAQAALDLLPRQGVIGLGSGSTAKIFIDGVAALVRSGRELVGVPTSEASRAQADALGIPLLPDEGPWDIDVCVDGADEVSEALDLIKGGGGCHTREKIVNEAARLNVIVVDESKMSRNLGEKWPVPVEVLAFARGTTERLLQEIAPTTLRTRDGVPWRTDSGNFIYDLAAGQLPRPKDLESRLASIPGVVDCGLFVGRADLVLIAGSGGVQRRERTGGTTR
jgi:ribose 5-phosphate isomerase A